MALLPMRWVGDGLELLDQRVLPHREEWLYLRSSEAVAMAIREMAVRGAPAIGIAAAYGMALALREGLEPQRAAATLIAARPTAVNLAWAVKRVMAVDPLTFESVLHEAELIEAEDLEVNLTIGVNGGILVPRGAEVLTICNTGALATAGHGTALGIIRSAHAAGKAVHVWVCETRPRLQGLRLTAYELLKDGIPFHVIVDNAAASLMEQGRVDLVIAGADRIAVNGDTANKIGTYSLAVLAKHHRIPFYIAAPSSTIDSGTPTGAEIEIEQRQEDEVTEIAGVAIAAPATPVYNPGFDVTPGGLVDAIITERGIVRPPYAFGVFEVLDSRA